MTDHVYSISEVVGSSPDSIEAAVQGALSRARRTLRNLNWFEVTEVRGHLAEDGDLDHYQVTIRIGFRLDD